jgi:hypothetical protein
MSALGRIMAIVLLSDLLLIGCAAAPPPSAQPAFTPTIIPPTATLRASATPLPPAPVPTSSPTLNPTTAPTVVPPQHRIGVRVVNGDGEFLDRSTGKKFVPRGYNYIRLGKTAAPCVDVGTLYHSTFNVGLYDAARTERALAAMQQDGYNTVRVFLNQICIVRSNGKLSSEYLENVADFLRRAKAHGVGVIIAYDDPPVPGYRDTFLHDPQIDWSNRSFLTLRGVEVEGRFWRDFIRGLADLKAPMDAILAYSLRNEMSYFDNVPPLSLKSGTVVTGNGKSYDMAKAEEKQQMMDDNLVFWIDRTRAQILEVDPTALVTVGFFVPQAPHPARIGDYRVTRPYAAMTRSSADFIDLHPYPGQELTLPQYVDNFETKGLTRKPFVMGEFGLNKNSYSTAAAAGQVLQDWQMESCQYGFDGWLLWTFDTTEDPVFWTGMDQDGTINRWLAPANRPDACAPGTQLSLGVDAAAPPGVRQVRGHLTDAQGKPFGTALPIQFSVKPLDGPGVFGVYTLSDSVPVGATQAGVGLRINLECNCQGTGDVALYKANFVQEEDPTNRVPDGDLTAGIGPWGHDPATVRLEASDRGSGRMLHITASPSQSVMLNSGVFPVVAGSKFTWTMEARVAPGSMGSGYWGLFFLGANGEVGRKKILLEPAAFATAETSVDANGAFQLTVSDLPAGTFQVEADYPGDERHLPGGATIEMER